ncbi:MAG: hypothetical protein FWG98_15020 [Candidatus Cloacimonetes bacterium]|nr:hypothetical protein [Candidatus Cloacimonadota bacterium]
MFNICISIKKLPFMILAIILTSLNLLISETIAFPPSNFHEDNAGSIGNPYLINNLANLRWLSETPEVWGYSHGSDVNLKRFFIQTADIDASETNSWNNGRGFQSIGRHVPNILLRGELDTESYVVAFSGDYDGNGFTIKNIFINNSFVESPIYISDGFFGWTENANIQNIHLRDIMIIEGDTNNTTGAVIGIMTGGNLANSSVSGLIVKNNYVTSGLVGKTSHSTIENCVSRVNIFSNRNFENFSYPDYTNASIITAGLIGVLSSSTLKNSYYNGKIDTLSAFDTFGDLIGLFSGLSKIQNCFSINNDTYTVYGLITDWDFRPFPIGKNDKRKLSQRQMQNPKNFSKKGFDFENVWTIEKHINNGFPHLISNEF